MNKQRQLLTIRALTSSLPRIKGVGIFLELIANHFKDQGLSDVEVRVFGRQMLLNPNDLIGRYLIFTPRYYDHRERGFINRVVKKGDYLIDVGANVGAYTLLFADLVGSNGLVTAIEAEKDNGKRLIHNIAINEMYWVQVENHGVSDTEETLSLLLNSTGNAGGHSFYEQSDTLQPPLQEVSCRPLSALIDRTRRPKLIKLDIEGFEHRVLKRYFEDVEEPLWSQYIMLEDIPFRREADAVALVLSKGYRLLEKFDSNIFLGR